MPYDELGCHYSYTRRAGVGVGGGGGGGGRGQGCSSVGRASDRLAVGAGSIPRRGKGFSSRINFRRTLSYAVRTALVCNRMP